MDENTPTQKDITSREDIQYLVDTFYRKVLTDESIAVFFTEVVPLDWEKHLPVMYDFWETVLLAKHTYQGNPMKVHQHLNQQKTLKKEHFDRWLALFTTVVDELFAGPIAELAKTRALSIATVIQIKLHQSAQT